MNTYRLNAHSKGDDDRSEEEIAMWWKKEPLRYIEKTIKTEIEQIELK